MSSCRGVVIVGWPLKPVSMGSADRLAPPAICICEVTGQRSAARYRAVSAHSGAVIVCLFVVFANRRCKLRLRLMFQI